ncbi:NADH-quinone oxidoreductase subunit NuoH [Mitsuokella sp.]|uniref:NADH-quinone oxidoreductase subunit NuoH n=1 Tax=Mitsuokella sp. TaxID=2049034 RepID=UPI002A7EEDCE|nr:NADH-quinone oxidoreductase subunit NuoH [Mitsuokella sp.]MDY4474311.1 NADH-quinone oxidoreductase subunit NuoH [Mitsuokella sp.]
MGKSLLSGIARWIHGEISTLTGSPLLSDLVLIVIGIAALLGIISLAAIVFTYAERKVCAFMQMRLGPNRVGGRFGLLQPVADMLKLMSKEDIMPAGADKVLWALSPALLFVPAALVYAFFPFDAGAVLVDVNVGVFLLLAISSQAVLPFLMGGYASNNKYSMIGGFRIVSQMISYEAPLLFSLLGILMITGSMRLEDIVLAQQGGHWFLFLQPLAFIIFLISAIAETNRTPFDLVEGESEIIAGPFTEYSGMRWALFFLAEYANLLTAAILATTFFLGGYLGPSFLPGFVWFTLKSVAMVFLIMWFRWTFPRTRVDQMLSFSWKALLPLAILNVFLTGAIMYALDLV